MAVYFLPAITTTTASTTTPPPTQLIRFLAHSITTKLHPNATTPPQSSFISSSSS